MSRTRSRLEPIERREWDENTPNILRSVAHHPKLLEPFLAFSATLARGALPRRASEMLALRAAWNCRSAFEWGHHVHYARAAGLDDDAIARIAKGPTAGWEKNDRTLLEAADELHEQHRLSERTWARLADAWTNEQLVEIPFVVGHYTMLSMVCGALDVELEKGLPPLPEV